MDIARTNPTRAQRTQAKFAKNAHIIFAKIKPISPRTNQEATTLRV